jgi:hypothetical protein
MTIEEALAQPGELVAAWDTAALDEAWLGLYTVGTAGAHLLAWERMETAQRAVVTERLRSRVRIGATYGSAPFVWVADAEGFAVWALEGLVCFGSDGKLTLPNGVVAVKTVQTVGTFVSEDDLGHRGVQVTLRDGTRLLVAEEQDPAARLDPTYNQDNASVDGGWTHFLAQDLAAWLGIERPNRT